MSWLGPALLMMLLSACGGHRAALSAGPAATPAPAAPALLAGLPAVADLDRNVSIVDGERWSSGYYSSIPGQNNDAGGSKIPHSISRGVSDYSFSYITFSPTWDPAVSAMALDTAWAGYSFKGLASYAGTARVELGWQTPPDYANLWIGLANYSTSDWQWFHAPAGGAALNLGSFTPYISPAGNTHVIVLVLGTAPAIMNYVLVGDPIVPIAYLDSDLTQDPLDRIGPLQVSFDASGSYGVGSTITNYELDYEGDGTYDDFGPDGLFSHTYDPGDHTARIRVTDNLAQTDTDEVTFHVINPNNSAPSAQIMPNLLMVTAPAKVDFDASSSSDSDGTIVKYEWDWDGDGSTDYTSDQPTASHTFAIQGSNFVQLKVTDNDLAIATGNAEIVCNNGWRRSTVAAGVNNVTETISATTIGTGGSTRALVAYKDDGPGSLMFVHGSASNGLSWDAPVTVAAGNFPQVQQGYCPSLCVESLMQVPTVAYGRLDNNGFSVKFAAATSNTGQVWNAPVAVSADFYLGADNCLTQLGGKLTLATTYKYGYQSLGEVRVYQATNASGTLWGAPQVIASSTQGEQIGDVRIVTPPGQLPVMMWRGRKSNISLFTAVAQMADGSAWGGPNSTSFNDTLYEGDFDLGLAGGNPAFCLGSSSVGSSLYFLRGDDAAGTGWTGVPASVDGGGTKGAYCVMATVNGKPAIAYSELGNNLKYVAAVDANGASWEEPQIVDSAGSVGMHAAMTVLPGNVPLIVYYDETNKRVRAAAFF
jgi:hypothetical protein